LVHLHGAASVAAGDRAFDESVDAGAAHRRLAVGVQSGQVGGDLGRDLAGGGVAAAVEVDEDVGVVARQDEANAPRPVRRR